MKVYRITSTRYANDPKGEGARLNGGRWNHKGTPVLYTSESRALALVEYSVNVPLEEIPRSLSLVTIEITGDVEEIPVPALPGNWQTFPAPGETRDYGTKLLGLGKTSIIRIPSVIIPQEFNYLINQLHPKSSQVKITGIADFVYDVRLKNV